MLSRHEPAAMCLIGMVLGYSLGSISFEGIIGMFASAEAVNQGNSTEIEMIRHLSSHLNHTAYVRIGVSAVIHPDIHHHPRDSSSGRSMEWGL